jgi:hypothetical protein
VHCFHHPGVDAVAVCKNCGRGLCRGCAVDIGNGLACPGPCENEARALNRVISLNKTSYAKTSGAYVRTALYYAVFGAVVLAGGVLDWRGMGWALIPAGVVLLVGALLNYSTARKFDQG